MRYLRWWFVFGAEEGETQRTGRNERGERSVCRVGKVQAVSYSQETLSGTQPTGGESCRCLGGYAARERELVLWSRMRG